MTRPVAALSTDASTLKPYFSKPSIVLANPEKPACPVTDCPSEVAVSKLIR
jgi:hypothetical protein